MDELAVLKWLLTMWVAITIVFAAMRLRGSWISMRTNNIVVLNASECGIPAEKAAISARLERITGCSRVLGYISLILLTGVAALFVHHAASLLGGV